MSTSSSDEVFINALRTIFGKRAIIFGEDPARYDELLVLVAADVKPRTMREWLVVKTLSTRNGSSGASEDSRPACCTRPSPT